MKVVPCLRFIELSALNIDCDLKSQMPFGIHLVPR